MTSKQSADLSDYLKNDPGHWEASIFLYLSGLLVSCMAYANNRGCGFVGEPPSLQFSLPQDVELLLGLKVDPEHPLRLCDGSVVVRLTPLTTEDVSSVPDSYLFWHRLFPENAPAVSMQFPISEADKEDGKDENWLVWDWWLPPCDRLALAKAALERLLILQSDEEWLPLLERSATENLQLLAESLIQRRGVPPDILERLRAS